MIYTHKKYFEVGDQVKTCASILGVVTGRTAKMVTIGFYDIIDGSIEFEKRYRIYTDYRDLECCGSNNEVRLYPMRPMTTEEEYADNIIKNIGCAHHAMHNAINMLDPHRYDMTHEELEELLANANVTYDQLKAAFVVLDKLDEPCYSPLILTIKKQHFSTDSDHELAERIMCEESFYHPVHGMPCGMEYSDETINNILTNAGCTINQASSKAIMDIFESENYHTLACSIQRMAKYAASNAA